MFSGLFIILLPLVVGYLLPLRHSSALKLINRMLSWIVYVILFFMGISLAFLDNLASNLLAILHYAAVSVVIILLCNIAALLWLIAGNVALTVVAVLSGIFGSVMMCTKDQNNQSVVDQVGNMIRFARSQQIYPYRALSEWGT
mgnify:CR=1 FL=1